ncbi:MAG TPA: hypothetical protein VHZ24_08405 [Pirellulales bacterium]|jgi:antitoxin component YwqK of YwqJK toxin-antitoxin module|nr:hypothetical protein [Pirellulales bacterium]
MVYLGRRFIPAVVYGSVVSVALAGAQDGQPFPLHKASGPVPVVAAAPTPIDPASLVDAKVEIFQERYPNTNIKIERSVTRDADGNYINHGPWTFWDETGKPIMKGEYLANQLHGHWVRYFGATEGNIFTGPFFKGFEAPFVCQADFVGGLLEGTWTITDSRDWKVCDMTFEHDIQNGKMIWYYPSGEKRREVSFKDGQMDGELVDYAPDGAIASKETYIAGRKIGTEIESYSPGHKKSERQYTYASQKVKYNFLEGTSTPVKEADVKPKLAHGPATWWYQNGQKQLEGTYEHDEPVGKFTWWYQNGQKSAEGQYVNGMQDGQWVWWHQNGQKRYEGNYSVDNRVGKWMEWKTDGKIVAIEDFTDSKVEVQVRPAGKEAKPIVGKPGSEPTASPALRRPPVSNRR